MASKVLLRVLAMLVCVATGSAIVAAYLAAELETVMPLTDEQAAPLFGILFRGGLLASVMLAGAAWKLWLFPAGYQPPRRVEQPAEERATI